MLTRKPKYVFAFKKKSINQVSGRKEGVICLSVPKNNNDWHTPNSGCMSAMLGVTHMHEGGGPIRQLHHGSGAVVYSNHLAAIQHLSYSLTCYVVQHDAPWW